MNDAKALTLNIISKSRPNPTAWVGVRDFSVSEAGTMSLQQVQDDPTITLYCLDHAQRRAIFVQTEPEVNLTAVPFFYQAQFEHAKRLIAVPYAAFFQIGLAENGRHHNLALIYSIGRCGSTLISRVFNEVGTIYTLSEPDVFTQILRLRILGQSDDAELKMLLRSAILSLKKPATHLAETTHWVIKFRSYCVELADLIYDVFPEARLIFLYRNILDWSRSTVRAFQKLDAANAFIPQHAPNPIAKAVQVSRRLTTRSMGSNLPERVNAFWDKLEGKVGLGTTRAIRLRTGMFPLLKEHEQALRLGTLSAIENIVLECLSGMSTYLNFYADHRDIVAVRYEDLITEREQILRVLFRHLGLPAVDIAQLLHVFDQDAQAGTSLSRSAIQQAKKTELSEEHIAEIIGLLRRYPHFSDPDVILPGTVAVPLQV